MRILLFLLPLLLVQANLFGQSYPPTAYWNFEQADWQKDTQNKYELTGRQKLTRSVKPDLVQNYLPFTAEQPAQLFVPIKTGNAMTVEYWFRLPARNNNLSMRLFWSSDRSFFTTFQYSLFRFSTKVKTASGKIVDHHLKIFLRGSGRNSYGYYVDGNWHHLVFKYDARLGKKEIWVDGKLPEGFSTVVTDKGTICGSNTKTCENGMYFSFTGVKDNNFKGDLDELAIYQSFVPENLHIKHYVEGMKGKPYTFDLPQSAPKLSSVDSESLEQAYDMREFAPGHPDVTIEPINQLRQFPRPRFLPNHTLHRSFNWMGMRFFGGEQIPGTSREKAVRNSVAIQEELALNWNYSIALQNTKMARSDAELNDPTRFLCGWIDLANKYPEIPLSVTTFWAQVVGKDIGDLNSRPNIRRGNLPASYYLRDQKGDYMDKNGKFINRPAQLSILAPAELLQRDGDAQRFYLNKIQKRLTRPINIINENGEVPPLPLLPSVLEKDPSIVRHKKKLNISDWSIYQAIQKTQLRRYYSAQFLANNPALAQAEFTWYAVDGGPQQYNRFAWAEARKINRKINGQYYPTPDFYPRWPHNWQRWAGAWHGWEWIAISRKEEIKAGDKLFSPYIGAGWHRVPEKNVRPSQWLGLIKNMGIVGAEFFYTGFFNEGSAATTFPDPRNYTWQAALPGYAQALTSRYEDILRTGDLLTDESGEAIVNYWAGDPRILVSIRKAKDKAQYVIAGSIQPITNYAGSIPDTAIAEVDFDGLHLQFEVRRQGSVYIYDYSAPSKPVFYQLDSWHETGHPTFWSNNFRIEAEVYDETSGVEVQTIRESTSPNDYTSYTSFVSPTRPKSEISYYFEPTQLASYQVIVHSRSSDNSEGHIQVMLNGNPVGKPMCIKDSAWEWYSGDGKTKKHIVLSDLPPGKHRLTLQISGKALQLDKVELKVLKR